MAGLFFDYSHDSVIWKVPYQFMLGRHLLVAPVTEPGALTWKVYLPEGGWTSFWTQQEEQGPKWIEVDTPLDRIPVFVKIDAPLTLISRKKN
jgi:alpha-glucosidase (family GH31 glycosyl hydrolase)